MGHQYMLFTHYNSITFLSALSIIFLLLTGFPFKYKPFMWLLNLSIAGNITFMALTFMQGMYLVAPFKIEGQVTTIYYRLFYTWIAIVGIVNLQHTIRFVYWAFGHFSLMKPKSTSASGFPTHHSANTAATTGVKKRAGSLNKSGLTVFGMIGQLPKDFKSIKILNTLQDHVRGQQTQKHDHNLVPALSLSSININGKKSKESTARASSKSWRSKCQRYIGKYDVDWVKDKSGALMIVAAVIATITFQTAVNPPGGVWHQDINTTVFGPYCGNGGADTCVVGTAVLAHIWEDDYMLFMACKSIAFLASLSIIFLLLTGFPVKYRPLMWLLNFALCRRSDLYVTYLHAILYLVSPFSIDHRVTKIYTH